MTMLDPRTIRYLEITLKMVLVGLLRSEPIPEPHYDTRATVKD